MTKPKNNYINNKELYALFVKYKEDPTDNKVYEELGKAFRLIAENMAKKSNFKGYKFRDDMISEACETCVRYFRNFDVDKYNNPFGYFTHTINNSFIKTIVREKENTQRQAYIVTMSGVENMPIFEGGEDYQFINDNFQKFYDVEIPEQYFKKRKKRGMKDNVLSRALAELEGEE